MSNSIDIDELSNVLVQELETYLEEVDESIDVAANKVTKQLVADIREDSPTDKGNYKKGWTRKKLKNSRVVYNRTHGGLTYLLEHGHNKIGDGRTKAIPHIYKNSKIATDNFEDMCVAIVSEGLRFK